MTDPIQPAPATHAPDQAPAFMPVPYGPPVAQPPGGAAPGAAFGWGAPAPVPPRSRGLGLAALLIAAPLFLLSIIASVVVGMSAGPYATRTSTSFAFNTSDLSPAQAEAFAPVGVLMGVQLLLGTVLGILALVLGIIAVATKRGRAFGVVAIVRAAAAPIVSFAVYVGALIATLPPA